MNTLVLLIVCCAIIACGYKFYGDWLCKQWGVCEKDEPTPAHVINDGVDYVPAKAPVLMGHHFSSIAGAGPITGPISAMMFGWVPIVLWVLVGGIFFGGVHDFGALIASIRHKGLTIGEIIAKNVGPTAKKLFVIFAYLTLILVVAAFSSIVAGTFCATYDASGAVDMAASATNSTVAMVSICFIVLAIVFGFAVYRRNAPVLVSTIVGIAAICFCLWFGLHFHPIYLSNRTWMVIIGIYIAVASVAPVWILLQPRDYLSSFLLYAMIIVALIGIIGAHPAIPAEFPAFNSANASKIFPLLFTTIACGAISGFHSLVSSGTTSKQLDKEKDAKPIAYGGMLLECVLAIVTVCAIAYEKGVNPNAKGVTEIFAGGISSMVATIPGMAGLKDALYTLLVLAYSVFCLTSLDTATRIARGMFQELWLEPGQTPGDVKDGWKKILVNPLVATIITVVLGTGLGLTGWQNVWPLFGAANQLLAGIGLLAVATWLHNIGRNNKMIIFPMCFMLVVTICSLLQSVFTQMSNASSGNVSGSTWPQIIVGTILVILAVILSIEGFKVLGSKKKTA